MVILESIVSILSSSTAKSLGKFLYDKIDGYLKTKYGSLAQEEKLILEKQIGDLKKINSEIQKKQVIGADVKPEVDDLKNKVVEIEDLQNKKKFSETLISPELLDSWIEKEDLEDQVIIARKRLELLIEKALEMGVKDTKRWELEKASDNLVMHMNDLRKTRADLHDDPEMITYQQRVKQAENSVRNNLRTANVLFKNYKEIGW